MSRISIRADVFYGNMAGCKKCRHKWPLWDGDYSRDWRKCPKCGYSHGKSEPEFSPKIIALPEGCLLVFEEDEA